MCRGAGLVIVEVRRVRMEVCRVKLKWGEKAERVQTAKQHKEGVQILRWEVHGAKVGLIQFLKEKEREP